MKIPRFVLDWARARGIGREDIVMEIGKPDWKKVSEQIVSEDKYSNTTETIWRHADSGRYIRVLTNTQPYGIDDYGAPPDDEDIVEVFPVDVVVRRYLPGNTVVPR